MKPEIEDDSIFNKLIGPPSLAIAIAETVRDYVRLVESGDISYPAHRRESLNVADVWSDVRIEALRNLFNFGKSQPYILSDWTRQEEILICFLDDQPHLEIPQPRGEVVPDTIQATINVYRYLESVGQELMDRETDGNGLKMQGKTIIDTIQANCMTLRSCEAWPQFKRCASQATLPKTIIEILYEDVTLKCKSIALTSVFGHNYESGIRFAESILAKNGANTTDFNSVINRIMDAKSPEDIYTMVREK